MHNDANDNEFPPSIISGLQVNQLKTPWQTAFGDILRKSGPVVRGGGDGGGVLFSRREPAGTQLT